MTLSLEQIGEQLQRDVLECERRTVGHAKQKQIRLEGEQRRDLVAAEGCGGVRAADDRLQVRSRYVVGVARKNRERELPIIEWTQRRQLGGSETRIALRHREPTIGRETLEQDRREGLRRKQSESRAARADVAHQRSSERIFNSALPCGCAPLCR